VEYVLAVLILVAVIAFVTVPLRRRRPGEPEPAEDPRIAELEARKEAKYREIRDTELDRAAGKLSEEDYRRQDAELRGEAIEILKQLDRARAASGRPDRG
jgi:hypothetical protein